MVVTIDPIELVVQLGDILENHKGIQKIKDYRGHLVIPVEHFGDFVHDLAKILSHVIEKVAELEEE